MGRKRDQIVKIKEIEVETEQIEATFPAPVTMRGSSYYIRLDPDFVRFWDIQIDDELLITVTKLKRERHRLEKAKEGEYEPDQEAKIDLK